MINDILNFIKNQGFVKKILKGRVFAGLCRERQGVEGGSALNRLRLARG